MTVIMYRLLILLLLSIYFISCLGDFTKIVQLKTERVKGYLSSDGYYQFLGIPYGMIPQDHPFGISRPYPTSSAIETFILDATSDEVHCPQMPNDDGTITGVLDCLTLNAFVPATATDASKLPVIVYIYGGHFHTGQASAQEFGPKYFVRHNVIFVSFNYRTGPYGFMCLDDVDVPGNQGLRDQYLALQWVKDNIESFGGDPNQITLMGSGAGGSSVDLHLLSSKKRLFNKAIIQSGSSMDTTLLYPPDRLAAVKIAQRVGFEGNDTYQALRYLKYRDPSDIMKAAIDLEIQFKPCVEREILGLEPFLSHEWVNALVPNVEGVPIMIGFNEYEMVMEHLNQPPTHFQNLSIFNEYLEQTFDFDDEKKIRMERYLRRFYVGDNNFSQNDVWKIVNFDSDFVYNYPIQRSIDKFLKSNSGDIFYYMFSYVGERNLNRIKFGSHINVAGHGDEQGYLFDRSDIPGPVTEADQFTIDRMTTLWTNFVKYGNPTPTNTELVPINWIPLTSEIYNYLKIDSTLEMQTRPFHRSMAFLELFYRLNNEHQRLFEPVDVDNDDGNSVTAWTASLTLIALTLALLSAR